LKEVTLERIAVQLSLNLWKGAIVFWQVAVFLPCEQLNARQVPAMKETAAGKPTCVLAPGDGTTQRVSLFL
jgi:hypothetical protein